MTDMKKLMKMCAFLLAAVSCTTFEDRTPCPDFVVLDLDYAAGRSDNGSFRLYHWQDGVLETKEDMTYTPENHSYDIPVRDGMVDIVALSPCDSSRLDEEEKTLLIPLGEQHRPFYGLARRVYVDGADSFISGVRLYKQFSRLKFRLRRVPYDEYSVSVQSDVCGLDMLTLEPVRGAFLYEFRENDIQYECVLPRQFEDSELKIVIRNKVHGETTPDIEIPVGDAIRREYYDWSYPELADIYAYVDVAKEIAIIQIIQ